MIRCVLCFLLLLSVRPADHTDPAEHQKMIPDNYKLITSEDGPLSAQIKYTPAFILRNLFKKEHSWKEEHRNKCRCSPCSCVFFLWLSLKNKRKAVYMWIRIGSAAWLPEAEPCLRCRALRQTDSQSGRSDPAVEAQMTDLQAEAQSLEGSHSAAAGGAGAAEDGSRSKTDDDSLLTQWRLYLIFSISLLNMSPTFLFAWSVISEQCRIIVLSGNKAADSYTCCRFKTEGKFPLSNVTVLLKSRGEASSAGSELGAAGSGAGEPEAGGGDPPDAAGQREKTWQRRFKSSR